MSYPAPLPIGNTEFAAPTQLPPLPQGYKYIRGRRGALMIWAAFPFNGAVASRVYGGYIRVIQQGYQRMRY